MGKINILISQIRKIVILKTCSLNFSLLLNRDHNKTVIILYQTGLQFGDWLTLSNCKKLFLCKLHPQQILIIFKCCHATSAANIGIL